MTQGLPCEITVVRLHQPTAWAPARLLRATRTHVALACPVPPPPGARALVRLTHGGTPAGAAGLVLRSRAAGRGHLVLLQILTADERFWPACAAAAPTPPAPAAAPPAPAPSATDLLPEDEWTAHQARLAACHAGPPARALQLLERGRQARLAELAPARDPSEPDPHLFLAPVEDEPAELGAEDLEEVAVTPVTPEGPAAAPAWAPGTRPLPRPAGARYRLHGDSVPSSGLVLEASEGALVLGSRGTLESGRRLALQVTLPGGRLAEVAGVVRWSAPADGGAMPVRSGIQLFSADHVWRRHLSRTQAA